LDLTGEEPRVRFVVDGGELGPADLAGWAPAYKGARLATKRVLDVVIASLILLANLPVLAIVGLVILITDGRPIVFTQDRVGRGGELVGIHKLRTMRVDAEERLSSDPTMMAAYVENDFKLDLDVDPRVTRFGRVLRRLSIDELPQLWNVIKGDMSMVGPRPVMAAELESYGEFAPAYLAVSPGVTGAWQTSGRNDIRYPERAHLDVRYAAEWTLTHDLRIIAKTLPSVLKTDGVA